MLLGVPSSHPLRRTFDAAEQLVARPVEGLIRAPRMSHVLRTSGRIVIWSMREARRTRGRAINLVGLPSERDLRRLAAQVARLQRTVDEIEQQIHELPPLPVEG